MSRVMVDTNILIRFFGAPEDFVSSLGAYERIVISPIVVGEFWAGINNTRRGRESRLAFEAFLENPFVDEVPVDSATGRYYAKIYQAIKQAGTPIPTNDIWIAASAIQHDCPLFTQDAHFKNVPGLKLA